MPRALSSKNSGAEVTNLYLPVRIKKIGRELAEKKNLSLSQLVAQLIEENNEVEMEGAR
jgi:predicted DNA-binding ribbon-helix-helix protein